MQEGLAVLGPRPRYLDAPEAVRRLARIRSGLTVPPRIEEAAE